MIWVKEIGLLLSTFRDDWFILWKSLASLSAELQCTGYSIDLVFSV